MYLKGRPTPEPMPAGTIYTCPMHPEIEQVGPATAQFAAWRSSRRAASGKVEEGDCALFELTSNGV